MLFALSVVGSTVAVFSQASFEPGSKERCEELYRKLFGPAEPAAMEPAYTASDKEEYYKYCPQWSTTTPSATDDTLRTCDDLKRLIESGTYTAYEKEQWANCERGRDDASFDEPTYTCDELKKIMDSGKYDSDQKQLWLNCQQGYKPVPRTTSEDDGRSDDDRSSDDDRLLRCQNLMSTVKKYGGTMTLDAKTQLEYDECQRRGDESRNDCEDLRAKLEKLSAEPNSKDYAETKAEYVKACYNEEKKMREEGMGRQSDNFVREDDQCKNLRAKMTAMNNAGQTDSREYANLKASFQKQCEIRKMVPPAGFEEEVLVNVDAYNNPFPDTDSNGREGKAAAELYRRGVIGGFADGEFKGDRPVNRAEAAKFLLLACGKDTEADYSGKFRDLMKGQWYVPYVEAAARLGIINGYADGNFRPANTVNRAEFSKMITKACMLPEDLDHSLFTDVKSEDWFAMFAGAVQKYSLYPDSVVDNLFKPANLMTRSEVAIAIYQYLTNR